MFSLNTSQKSLPVDDTYHGPKNLDASLIGENRYHSPRTLTQELKDEANNYSVFQQVGFFIKHSYRDVSRHKCHFFLAMMSVLVVILSSLIVNTVISKGPIVFLTQAQGDIGEYDGYFTFSRWRNNEDLNSYSQTMDFLDYSKFKELHGDKFNLSPRFHFCDVDVTS